MIPLRDSETLLSRPVVTHVLIALNVAVFLYELTLGPELEGFVRTWGLDPAMGADVARTLRGYSLAILVPRERRR